MSEHKCHQTAAQKEFNLTQATQRTNTQPFYGHNTS